MRILVYGAGVLGGNLALNLYKAGKDVSLVARGEWAETIREKGLVIKRKYGGGTVTAKIPVITALEKDDVYDVIFLALRYTQLDGVMDILRANGSKNIVFVGNNVRVRHYAENLPGKNVLFAFALSAGHREKDRIVGVDLKKITIGHLKGGDGNEGLCKEIFAHTRYRVVYEPNMEDYLLCHGAFILPAALAVYHAEGDLRRIRKDKEYLNLIIDANIEGYRAIEKSGHEIIPESDRSYESPSYRRTCLLFYRLMCSTPLGKICASDHAMNAQDEMSALNRDLKKFFDDSGVDYPKWRKVEESAASFLEREKESRKY